MYKFSKSGYSLVFLISFITLVVGGLIAFFASRVSNTVAPDSGEVSQGSSIFLAFGDSGGLTTGQKNIAKLLETTPSRFIIHTGDIAYQQGTASQLRAQFIEYYSNSIKNKTYPTLGNHDDYTDNGGPYLGYFAKQLNSASKGAGGRYYSKDIGKFHIVSLDTNDSLAQLAKGDNSMIDWLIDDLSKTRDEEIVVFFHHPPFAGNTTHESNEFVKEKLVPVFDKYKVRLVFSGHNHNYLRTCKLTYSSSKELCQPQGTTYIVTGGGGKDIYQFKQPTPAYVASQSATYHFVKTELIQNKLHLTAIDENGKSIDDIWL